VIDPGKLRERVTIQEATSTRNRLGESVPSQQQTEATHRVRMRYVPGMNQMMRFLWRGRVLEMTSLLEHYNRTEHEALCTEQVVTQ
jgi:head-tail adaptor